MQLLDKFTRRDKLIKIAMSEYGIEEHDGSEEDNPEILKYFKATRHKWVKHDETAWCSAFMNWVALTAGCQRTQELTARSWLDIGLSVEEPWHIEHIHVVVLWREHPNSWKGHVGIPIAVRSTWIYILGGNQSNKVCIKPYPKSQVLDYRRLLEDE